MLVLVIDVSSEATLYLSERGHSCTKVKHELPLVVSLHSLLLLHAAPAAGGGGAAAGVAAAAAHGPYPTAE